MRYLFAPVLLLAGFQASATCNMYEHTGYSGQVYRMSPNSQTEYVGGHWNDRVSSIEVAPRCRLIAYQHESFRGAEQVFTGNNSYVGNFWNDQISSTRCECDPVSPPPRYDVRKSNKVCKLFQHADFQGKKYPLFANSQMSVLNSRSDWNDEVSSVKVPRGCRLTVYEHKDYRGASTTFYAGKHEFVGRNWNDRVSSAACYCD